MPKMGWTVHGKPAGWRELRIGLNLAEVVEQKNRPLLLQRHALEKREGEKERIAFIRGGKKKTVQQGAISK